MNVAQRIIEAARSYVGVLERPGNTGWYNADFQAAMKKAGWYNTAPWCAYFVKWVWMMVYADNKAVLAVVNTWFNGSAKQTYDNAKRNRTFAVGSVPKPGAIVVWLNGRGPAGHAGIVVSVSGNTMTTIEGNTNISGSREGDRVAEKLRTVNRDWQASGLNVYGYIYPLG